MPDTYEKIPFGIFVEYMESVASIKPRKTIKESKTNENSNGAILEFHHWVESLHRPIPPRTGAILFRLLFPQQDIRRKWVNPNSWRNCLNHLIFSAENKLLWPRYNLQETALGRQLAHVFGVATGTGARGEGLIRWNQNSVDKNGVDIGTDGCLGLQVAKIRNDVVCVLLI